jgi:hypothetical protein
MITLQSVNGNLKKKGIDLINNSQSLWRFIVTVVPCQSYAREISLSYKNQNENKAPITYVYREDRQ